MLALGKSSPEGTFSPKHHDQYPKNHWYSIVPLEPQELKEPKTGLFDGFILESQVELYGFGWPTLHQQVTRNSWQLLLRDHSRSNAGYGEPNMGYQGVTKFCRCH